MAVPCYLPGMEPFFIGSQIYRGSSYGRLHPLSIPRVPTVIDLCRAMGWLDEARVVRENLMAIRRAGADQIITYHARDAIKGGWL